MEETLERYNVYRRVLTCLAEVSVTGLCGKSSSYYEQVEDKQWCSLRERQQEFYVGGIPLSVYPASHEAATTPVTLCGAWVKSSGVDDNGECGRELRFASSIQFSEASQARVD